VYDDFGRQLENWRQVLHKVIKKDGIVRSPIGILLLGLIILPPQNELRTALQVVSCIPGRFSLDPPQSAEMGRFFYVFLFLLVVFSSLIADGANQRATITLTNLCPTAGTALPRQPLIELFVLTSRHFPLRNSGEKGTSSDNSQIPTSWAYVDHRATSGVIWHRRWENIICSSLVSTGTEYFGEFIFMKNDRIRSPIWHTSRRVNARGCVKEGARLWTESKEKSTEDRGRDGMAEGLQSWVCQLSHTGRSSG